MKQQVKVNWSGHSPGRCHRSPTTAGSLPWAVPPGDILRPGCQIREWLTGRKKRENEPTTDGTKGVRPQSAQGTEFATSAL